MAMANASSNTDIDWASITVNICAALWASERPQPCRTQARAARFATRSSNREFMALPESLLVLAVTRSLSRMGFLSRTLVPRSVRRAAHPIRTTKSAVRRAIVPKPVRKAMYVKGQLTHPLSSLSYHLVERPTTTSLRSGSKPRKRANRNRTDLRTAGGNPTPHAFGRYSQAKRVEPVAMCDVTGTPVGRIAHSGTDLAERLSRAASALAVAPWVTVIAALIVVGVWPYGLYLGLAAIPMIWWLHKRDRERQTVLITYELAGEKASAFERLQGVADALGSSAALWRVTESGDVQTLRAYKTNAGVDRVIDRVPLAYGGQPRHLLANSRVPVFRGPGFELMLLPDRLLVSSGKVYADVTYDQLRTREEYCHLVEAAAVPRDATVVEHTWQFVNKSGGPDRRYKNNPFLPVLRYEQARLSTASGMLWIIQASRVGTVGPFCHALNSMGAKPIT